MAKNGDFGEFELLRQLTNASGVPGREERIRDIVTEATRGMWDQTQVDAMGNLICLKKPPADRAGQPNHPARPPNRKRS